MILSHGSNIGGYSLFIKGKKLYYAHNYVGVQEFQVSSREEVPEGRGSSVLSSSRPARRISPKARGRRAARSFTSTASSSDRATFP